MKRIIFLFGFIVIGAVSVVIYKYHTSSAAIPYINLYQNEPTEGARKAISQKKLPSEAKSPIRIAIGAMVSPRRSFLYYQDLLDYISEILGRPVKMIQRRTYKEVNDLLEKEELDAALICSGPYVELKDAGKVELLVAPVVNGAPHYYSYLIVHHDSAIQNLEELRNKSFAFSDPLSNSGHLYPLYFMSKHGYSPDRFFSKTIFTYSHDNSIQTVEKGIADGAAVDSLIWDYFEKTTPEFVSQTRIIHRSPPFGIPPVVIPAGLDAALKKELEECFLTIHKTEKGKTILEKLMIERFIKVDDSLYDFTREMKKFVSSK